MPKRTYQPKKRKRAKTHGFRKKMQYIEKPKFGTDNPYFKIHFAPAKAPVPAGSVFGTTDTEYLYEIWLKGPQGQKWQDAF